MFSKISGYICMCTICVFIGSKNKVLACLVLLAFVCLLYVRYRTQELKDVIAKLELSFSVTTHADLLGSTLTDVLNGILAAERSETKSSRFTRFKGKLSGVGLEPQTIQAIRSELNCFSILLLKDKRAWCMRLQNHKLSTEVAILSRMVAGWVLTTQFKSTAAGPWWGCEKRCHTQHPFPNYWDTDRWQEGNEGWGVGRRRGGEAQWHFPSQEYKIHYLWWKVTRLRWVLTYSVTGESDMAVWHSGLEGCRSVITS